MNFPDVNGVFFFLREDSTACYALTETSTEWEIIPDVLDSSRFVCMYDEETYLLVT